MKPVETNVSLPKLEEEVLEFWKKNKVFQKSLNKESKKADYVFYDGPPFATGLPHYGHLLAGTIKDVIGRFYSMKGYHVDRRFGWDCHGVPVEFEIQKSLELHGSKAIKDFGIDKFNESCREIVLRYSNEWKAFVERSGRWVDFDRQYRTMDIDFMESIWWVFGELWKKGLIYQGIKCVPYSWAINTPLSNFEANLNYKNVQDPAVTVRVRLSNESISKIIEKAKIDAQVLQNKEVNFLIWTTTPWTLPSNMALAVGKDIEYSAVLSSDAKEIFILATSLLAEHFEEFSQKKKSKEDDEKLEVLFTIKGADLENLSYEQIFPYFDKASCEAAFKVYFADFVSDTDGTGIVHLASFGEDDVNVFIEKGITIFDPVDDDGNFNNQVSDFAGQNVKKADPQIVTYLKNSGQLFSHKTIEHSYPFCWRTDTPLIYKSISTWFVRVEEIKDRLIKANSEINWVPGHLKDGRFGKWLEGARDWAISRNRFWGTPIPLWQCVGCEEFKCISSVAELEELSGEKVDDLHNHFIDKLELSCKCGSKMKRVTEVLDCWFESGSMPYAQAHYPFENRETFEANFPADFIAEGLDQTRGWFYTLLVLSTALFDKPAFKNVIVNGIVLAEDGKKMSKSLQNYPPPNEVMDDAGADAMRLYLLSSAATRAEDLRFSKKGVRDVVRQTLLPLWNAYNFFVTYALVDRWDESMIPDTPATNLLDKWILSKTASLIERVDNALSGYRLYETLPPILDYVDQLTNWYIRLNRRRFWSGKSKQEIEDKNQAYATLYRAILSFAKVIAPLAPFISEEIFKNLSGEESVHLVDFPKVSDLRGVEINKELEYAMVLFEQIILLGRGLRNDTGIKLRQPLREATIVHASQDVLKAIRLLDVYIKEELNLKSINYDSNEEGYVNLRAKLNTIKLGKTLGPKLGSDGMKRLRLAVESLTTDEIRALEVGGVINLEGETLTSDDILISREVIPGREGVVASSGAITLALDTTINHELRLEGISREFVNRVQKLRKEFGFDVADRIVVRFYTTCTKLTLAVQDFTDYIKTETLSVEIIEEDSSDSIEKHNALTCQSSKQEIEGEDVVIGIERVQG